MFRTHRAYVQLLVFLAVLWTECTSAADDVIKTKRVAKNVVVIVADDLGLQLGCYGDKQAQTPNIDRLAAEGMRFTRAYCTTASCSASRSVLMTGLFNHATGHYGHAHGDNHFATYDSVKSLPVILAEVGYRTCSIGKYHLAPKATYHFETYRNDGIQGARNSVRMAENAKAWIAENDSRPFFLYWCSTDPHRAAQGFANSPKDDAYPGITPTRFQPEKMQVPSWLPDAPEVRQEWAEFYEATNRLDQGVGTLTQALKVTGHWEDTLIIFLSDNGPPFPGAKTNLYDPGARLPLIVRDPTRSSGGSPQSGRTTDALVAWVDMTPTVLDWCGITPKPAPPIVPRENGGSPEGARPAKNAKTQPITFHGHSFLNAISMSSVKDSNKSGDLRSPLARSEAKTDADFDEIYLSHTFHEITMYYPMRAVISDRYKLIFNIAHELPYPFASDLYASPTWQMALKAKLPVYGLRATSAYIHRPRFELYDLEADPDELHNLVDDPVQAKRFTDLQDKLKAWQQQTRDPWVSKWEYE